MTLSRRTREVALVVSLLGVSALVLRANTRKPSQLGLVDRVVLRASAPLQAAVTGAVDGVAGAWRGYVYLVEVKRDNARLLGDNRRLQSEVARARPVAERLSRLERLMQLRAEVPSETIAARVVGVDTSPHFR